MGTAERRARERTEIRTRILDAARALFVERGVEAVTLRAIAQQIEYSATTIYLHFEDKDTLLRELVRHDFGVFAANLGRLARVADPIERLRKSGIAYVAFALAHPNHYRLMFMSPPPGAKDDLPPDHPSRAAYAFLRGIIADALAAGRLRRELSDVELVTQAAWAAVHGVASLHIAMAGAGDIPWRAAAKLARVVVDAFVRGLLRPASA